MLFTLGPEWKIFLMSCSRGTLLSGVSLRSNEMSLFTAYNDAPVLYRQQERRVKERVVCAQKGHCAMKRVRAANYRGAAQVFSLLASIPQSPAVYNQNEWRVPLESSLIFCGLLA